jgi:ADP-heptose:LPS heptosyltransferase
MLLFLTGIKQRIGYDSGKLSHLLLTHPVQLNRKQHAACMYHDLVAGLGLNSQAQRPQVIVHDTNLQAMRSLISGGGSTGPSGGLNGPAAGSTTDSGRARKLILLHPGISKLAIEKGVIKTWGAANWVSLIEKLIAEPGLVVALCGGPDDRDIIAEINERLAQSPLKAEVQNKLLDLYGKTRSLSDLTALIHLSDLIICVDSAPMHLAVGLDKPLVALFGPTDPDKLLWKDPKFVALRDARPPSDEDPFLTKRRPATPAEAAIANSCVEIPSDTVFRTAMDLLNSI